MIKKYQKIIGMTNRMNPTFFFWKKFAYNEAEWIHSLSMQSSVINVIYWCGMHLCIFDSMSASFHVFDSMSASFHVFDSKKYWTWHYMLIKIFNICLKFLDINRCYSARCCEVFLVKFKNKNTKAKFGSRDTKMISSYSYMLRKIEIKYLYKL
jgi:hypothetical protein